MGVNSPTLIPPKAGIHPTPSTPAVPPSQHPEQTPPTKLTSPCIHPKTRLHSYPQMDNPSESRREPALTVRRELRPFFAALFILQTFGLVARRFYIALAERSDSFWTALAEGDILNILAVSLNQLERDGAKAIISTVILMEVWDAMMGTRDAINDWLEKRRRQARAEGRDEGRAELAAEITAWYERRLAAEANNEPFNEPPPGVDDRRNGT